MSISVTPSAAAHIERILTKRGQGVGLKLAVKATGCSGYSYVIGVAEAVSENDVVFKSHGVSVIVPQDSMDYLQGTQVDLQVKGLNQQLIFDNPNAQDACGCGESFNLKD